MKDKPTIRIDAVSLLIPLLLLARERLSHALALLLAATLHECGHLLAARLLRISLSSFHISILGAQLQLKDPLLSYRREWLLCAAGPLFSLLFAGIGALPARYMPQYEIFSSFAMISLALGLVNLIPIGWLDGGRMFRACCYLFMPPAVAAPLLRAVSFFCFLLLWMTSVYLLLRAGNSLSLFVFSFSLFLRFFLSDRQ